jgi:hypothetical protein
MIAVVNSHTDINPRHMHYMKRYIKMVTSAAQGAVLKD